MLQLTTCRYLMVHMYHYWSVKFPGIGNGVLACVTNFPVLDSTPFVALKRSLRICSEVGAAGAQLHIYFTVFMVEFVHD